MTRSIGLTRSDVADITKAAAMATRKKIANARRSPLIVAAMIQTLPLKNTKVVSRTTGRARTARPPIVVRCDSVIRTDQPTTDPTPQPVRIIMITAATTASERCDEARLDTDDDAHDGYRHRRCQRASAAVRYSGHQPADSCHGYRCESDKHRRNHSRGEGLPSMTTSLPSVTRRTGNVQQCSVAYAANTGADRDQSRRHRPRIVGTDGSPRCKNQLSASSVADPRRAGEWRKGLMPGHTSAGRFAALSW